MALILVLFAAFFVGIPIAFALGIALCWWWFSVCLPGLTVSL